MEWRGVMGWTFSETSPAHRSSPFGPDWTQNVDRISGLGSPTVLRWQMISIFVNSSSIIKLSSSKVAHTDPSMGPVSEESERPSPLIMPAEVMNINSRDAATIPSV